LSYCEFWKIDPSSNNVTHLTIISQRQNGSQQCPGVTSYKYKKVNKHVLLEQQQYHERKTRYNLGILGNTDMLHLQQDPALIADLITLSAMQKTKLKIRAHC